MYTDIRIPCREKIDRFHNMDTIKFFFKNKEKKMWWRGMCFGVMFLCFCLFVSALFVPNMFRGTNLSAFPMGNVTLTLINDISDEEPPRPFKATFRDKGRQTQDVGDALSKGISMEIETIWFAYGEETPYLH
mgnify:FL=1